MILPKPRGDLSEALFATLRTAPDESTLALVPAASDASDAALALWVLHELSYRGFEDVVEEAEWDPRLLAVRRDLERDLERRLRDRWPGHDPDGDDFAVDLFAYVEGHDGRSLARFVQTQASKEQVLDLLRFRSIYHLKESDPTAWVMPRLPVPAKAALAELHYDEYGAGNPNRLHHHLFARGMEAVGLRSEYGAYLDDAPLEVLEMNNALSLFGFHRRLRGAALGHLAAFEATSSVPSRWMAQGLDRLDMADEMIAYYTEHVSADAVHEQLAVRSICSGLVEAEPEQYGEIFFGAFTCLDLENRLATLLLDRWAPRGTG
ncbi:MAG: iron-containing redox enzyme family protein [Actinomycetota bacterium]|nr:iron-containing redox enzyme family protein [Actinomycetota bacterium]